MWRLLLTLPLALAGCTSSRPAVPGVNPNPLELMAAGSGKGPVQARAQKAEPAPTPAKTVSSPGLLDLGPEATRAEGRVAGIRAVVNNEPILEEEVLAAASPRLVGRNTEAERAQAIKEKLDELIDVTLVIQDARSRMKGRAERFWTELENAASVEFEKQWLYPLMTSNKYTNEDAFKRFLTENGMPYDIIRRQWQRQFVAMEYLRFRIEPHITRIDRQHVADYYERNQREFTVPDEVEWQNLFIAAGRHPNREAARAFAAALLGRVQRGEDFVKLTKEHDNGLSGLRPNAEGTGKRRGEIRPPEAEAALFRMRDGEAQLVEMETGFLIARVVKRQQAGLLPFDSKVQKQIRDKLRGQVFQREMKRIVADLKRQAIIEFAR